MTRRINLSQLQNELRRMEQDRGRRIDKYNQAVRQYNTAVRNAVNQTNRVIDNYNRDARAHNARVREQNPNQSSARCI